MKKLVFKFPFDRFSGLGFHNCYTSVYLFLQGAAADKTEYYCRAMEGKGCNDCGNCAGSLAAMSETLNNLFAVMTIGHSVTRSSWSGEKTRIQTEIYNEYGDFGNVTDKLVDFVIGFTGYEYKKINEGFKESVTAAIDAGKPVLAKVIKDESSEGPFRVIMGYDGDTLVEPNYMPVADLKAPTAYDNIEFLYVFGEKIPQKYTFLDVLKHVERIMDSDFSEGIWYDFAYKFDYEGEKLWDATAGEMKKRFKRLGDVADWLSCMSHAMQIAFGDRKMLESLGVNAGRLREMLDVIGHQTHLLHGMGYMENALRNSVNALVMNDGDKWAWEVHGLITSAALVLDSIIECDYKILTAIKKAIRMLQK